MVHNINSTNRRSEETSSSPISSFTHPAGRIVLLDGRELECVPRTEPQRVVDNSLSVDTSGTYLVTDSSAAASFPAESADEKALKELFVNNAFYLWEHRERILSDSRMFLCPVAVKSGLAYTGRSGFLNPTLGVYLEWWMTVEGARPTDKEGRRSLVYYIAGSPLSGMNHCGAVRDDGERVTVSFSPFIDHWRPFTVINDRYNEAKARYEAYSLQQVLDILAAEDK